MATTKKEYITGMIKRLKDNDPALTKVSFAGEPLGEYGAMLVADALKNNTSAISLDLRNSQVKGYGAKSLADMLRTNTVLRSLYLSGNQISFDGGEALAEVFNSTRFININKTLTTLSITVPRGHYILDRILMYNTSLTALGFDCSISKDCNYDWGDALKSNTTLTYLGITNAGIGSLAAKCIADGLRTNKTLVNLNLRNNCFGPDSVQHFANLLEDNETLTTLDLSGNRIGSLAYRSGQDFSNIKPLADSLKTNKTLTTLILDNTGLMDNDLKDIADALEKNKTLTTLSIRNNPNSDFTLPYFFKILNVNKTLTTLNFEDTSNDPDYGYHYPHIIRKQSDLRKKLNGYLLRNLKIRIQKGRAEMLKNARLLYNVTPDDMANPSPFTMLPTELKEHIISFTGDVIDKHRSIYARKFLKKPFPTLYDYSTPVVADAMETDTDKVLGEKRGRDVSVQESNEKSDKKRNRL